MIRLHDYLNSGNGYKVRLVLTLLNIPFELLEYDILAGETRTPEFLARNPNGRIPLLELEDGRHLAESNAIIFHLAEGSRFLPEDAFERALVLQWMFFEQYSHEPNIASSRFIRQYLPPDDERHALLPAKRDGGYAALDVMEGHLAERTYFVGEVYSLADITLYAYTHVADEGGFDLDGYPAVRAWLARVAAEPGHIEMVPK